MIDTNTIIYVVLVFIFIKYGLKELNIVYMIIISIGIVYYLKPYVLNIKKKDDALGTEVETYLNHIEKYDNNNLLLKIRKNYKNLNKYLSKKNKNMGDIFFLKDKILDYINSLNIEHDDETIDNVYNGISQLIDKRLLK
jgi:hypothetical protein